MFQVSVEETFTRSAHLQVSLLRGAATLYNRAFLPAAGFRELTRTKRGWTRTLQGT